ncbi:hypothetical protein EXIGLDRAFT_217069 [Exidia glandulosa HHB12029]|uniref:Arrestin-like N-terminal domain-containing protein n=1 Tax=Exidia glandulosa HHB12029 TaxID=1314781 RepID=A0A165EFT4_EXIGL|nr:hypothetical protein EXIGLDRAFT_217069 [Exidia glandulosa HHB12029]
MDVLPPYTSHEAIGGTSHTVAHDKGGLEVQFFSHAVAPTSPPIFHNESIISGTLHLEVHESLLSSIHGVTVTLRGFEREMRGAFGQATTMSKTAEIGQTTFLSVNQELYTHDSGKLAAGTHSWPFALVFPKTFRSVSKKALDEEFELPPTFSAPGYPTYLLYELRCEVSKSTLAGDEIMSVPILYVPRREAARPSKARMLAYETGSPAPSPLHDSEGWQTATATTKVQVFNAREVDISVSFSLARPLEYARGTFIPFYMNLTCDDAQALDLLSTPQAFSIVLDRRLHASEPSGRRAVDERGNGQDTVSEGKYWRAEPNYEGHNTRAFEGEIAVGVQLMQNFTYPKLSLHVSR